MRRRLRVVFTSFRAGNMLQQMLTFGFLDRYRPYAPLVIRWFVGFVLIYGTQDNVFSTERMLEFRDFLATNGFPYPLFSARLSAYAQFFCGILITIGLATRPAALVMVANFVVALVMVHVGQPFAANIAPLAMLFGTLFLLLNGAGPWSVDAAFVERKTARALREPLTSLPGPAATSRLGVPRA